MNNPHGLYIHIPFCSHACSYCDFHFSTQLKYLPEMCASIRKEMELRKEEWTGKEIISIYFGGGTPGLLPPRELEFFFETFNRCGGLQTAREITLEANPENITPENIRTWNELGINRISLGIQSLKNEDLRWMQRTHGKEQSLASVEILKTHFKGTLSIDLIFGTPHKKMSDLNDELTFVLKNDIKHLSCYQLTVEEKTLLKKETERKKITLPDEIETSEQFMHIHDFLTQSGYEHYEVSNYAVPGHEAVHNSLYWKGHSYSGFGPSAHSYDGLRLRKKNIPNNHEYMRRISKSVSWFEEEILNDRNYWNDFILTRLRTSEGLRLDEINQKFSNSHAEYVINTLKTLPSEWFRWKEASVCLSGKGMLFADYVTMKLFTGG